MQLTLRRRYRLGLCASLLLLLGAGLLAKRRMDAAEGELGHERAAAAQKMEAMQLALDQARAEVEMLQRFPLPGDVATAAAAVSDEPAAVPPALSQPPPPPRELPPTAAPLPDSKSAISAPVATPLPTGWPPPPPPPVHQPAGAAVEAVLRYIDARAQPPPDARTIVIMGSKQMLHRDKQFYLDAFHAIGYTTIEIGDASDPLIPWQPSDSGWSGILCLSLTDGEEKCLHKHSYAGLKPYQRIGRLPGLRHTLWNKDAFCRTLKAVGTPTEHRPAGMIDPPVALDSFSFNCWVLPAQYAALQTWGSEMIHRDQKYIVKPLSAGEGIGIKLLDDLRATAPYASMAQSHVVQPYLANPLLIHGYKFDIRSYVLVTGISPLRAYMYGEGLVRFASTPYKRAEGLGGGDATGRTAFLTNTAVNKKSGKPLSNLTWSFAQFREHATHEGQEVEVVFDAMHAVVAQTLLAAEPAFLKKWEQTAREHPGQQLHCSQHCYHLLGVDIIFDDRWHPRVIEVNGEPSMKPATHEKQSSPYNLLKRHMTADLAALVYGSAGSSSDGSASDLTTSSAAVLAVSRQLAQQRVGVVGVDCDATSPVGAGGAWSKGAQHDTCVGQDLLEYLLRSEREWTDRGGFHRIYPRPSRRNIVGGDELERLLGYIGQLYPEYGSATNAAAAAKDRAGVLGATTWMVHELLAAIEGARSSEGGLPLSAAAEPKWYGER